MLTSVSAVVLLSACASTPNKNAAPNSDPYQKYNRKVYQFNVDLNKALVKPVVRGYESIVPKFGRDGVHNFFGNIGMVPTIGNDALQANFRYMFRDMARFIINSTLGLLGTVDVASDIGLQPRVQSFGLTLAKWGMKDSPYVMLPLLGPSTVRGSFGLVPDYFMSPITYVHPDTTYWGVFAVQMVQNASDVLPREELITSIAIDPYIAVRNAYLQNRKYLVKKIINETPDTMHEGEHNASHQGDNSIRVV